MLKNLSLRVKLAIGFAIPILLLLAVAYVGFFASSAANEALSEVAEVDLPIVRTLEELKVAASRIISSTNEFVLDSVLGGEEAEEGEESEAGEQEQLELEQISTAVDDYHVAYQQYFDIEGDEEDALVHITAIREIGEELVSISTELIARQQEGASVEEIVELRENFEDTEIEFFAAVDAAVTLETNELLENQARVDTIVSATNVLQFSASFVAFILTIGVALYIFRSIAGPIGKLENAAKNLTAGDLTTRANLTSNDEIGQLANAFNTMAGRIQQLVDDLGQQVTDAETARSQAERSDQVKSAFLASMSHELRTPLNSIINFTKFVAKGTMGPVTEEQANMLNEVIDSAKHLLTLINDVLDMSKIESGSLKLFVEDDVDLKTILDTVVTTSTSLLIDKEVAVEANIPASLPLMRADRQRVLQILLNIMSNACKFTENGTIKLNAALRGGEVEISVEDTGPGIGTEEQVHVFEAFKQTRTGLRQGSGTGLGMPISKNLVEAHGGRLWFESVLGKGSTFFVRLPIKSDLLTPVNLTAEVAK